MNGREFGEALERAANQLKKAALECGSDDARIYRCIADAAYGSALQSITPGAGELPRTGAYGEGATCKHGIHPYGCVLGCHPEVAARFEYLKARDKWIEKHAKPAIERVCYYDYCDDDADVQADIEKLRKALAAMPQDPQGGVR